MKMPPIIPGKVFVVYLDDQGRKMLFELAGGQIALEAVISEHFHDSAAYAMSSRTDVEVTGTLVQGRMWMPGEDLDFGNALEKSQEQITS